MTKGTLCYFLTDVTLSEMLDLTHTHTGFLGLLIYKSVLVCLTGTEFIPMQVEDKVLFISHISKIKLNFKKIRTFKLLALTGK